MEVNFAFLCDYADHTGGKMAAIGIGFDTIFGASVPIRHSLFFAVISLKFAITEVGAKQVSMHLIDVDGRDILPPMESTINVLSPPSGFMYRNHNIALRMEGVTFPRYGDYTVSWVLNSQEIKNIPLKLAPPPAQRTTA